MSDLRISLRLHVGGLLLAAAVTSHAVGGNVVFVDDDAPPGGDGTTWRTAYRFLQDALVDAAGGGVTEIRVGQGTYKPDRDEVNPDGTGDREATFQLINGVALIGGYAGIGAKDPDARDIELFETTLSGDLDEDDKGKGVITDNSYTVVMGSGVNETALLDGFTVKAGNASEPVWGPFNRGGGFYSHSGSPTLVRCTFFGNRADSGGAVALRESTITITDCVFVQNVAFGLGFPLESYAAGGAVLGEEGSVVSLTDCEFVGNTTAGEPSSGYNNVGGAVAVLGSKLTMTGCSISDGFGQKGGGVAAVDIGTLFTELSMTDCEIRQNTSHGPGGGIYVAMPFGAGKIPVVLDQCLIEMNHCIGSVAGGVFLHQVQGSFTDCQVVSNYVMGSNTDGGGVWALETSLLWEGCLFAENIATRDGGAIFARESDYNFVNCEFSGNQCGDSNQTSGGAGIHLDDSDAQFTNTNFTANVITVEGGGGGLFGGGNGSIAVFSCVFQDNVAAFGGGGLSVNVPVGFTMTDCTFVGNTAGTSGGGARIGNIGKGIVDNCQFLNNSADNSGGGLWRSGENPLEIRDCTFNFNTASINGGGLYVGGNSPLFDCVFEGNVAFNGGGVYGLPIATQCHIFDNTANGRGGGIMANGSATITNCTLQSNNANNGGGGLSTNGGNVMLVNTLLTGNSTPDRGGAIFVSGTFSDFTIVNCTVAQNTATGLGGGIYNQPSASGETFVRNCILWDNIDINGSVESSQLHWQTGALSVDYCCMQGWSGDLGGIGNIGNNPRFGDPEDGVFRLAPASPCIDAGDNTAVPPDEFDLDQDGDTSEPLPIDLNGNPRFFDDVFTDDTGNGEAPIVDMGAYEFLPDCNNNGVPDIVDILDGTSEDCNDNSIPDECDVVPPFFAESGELGPIGFDSPQSFAIATPPVALGDVTLEFTAVADLLSVIEFIDVDINGVAIGSVFVKGAQDCPKTPDADEIIVPAAVFNNAVGGGNAVITMTATNAVNPLACEGNNYITVALQYSLGGMSDDDNNNGVPDECETPGDLNGDGMVGVDDLLILLGNWGPCADCDDCVADIDGDCSVGVKDLLILLANWG